MWNYWLRMEYSSNTKTMPTGKDWALMGDELRYDNNKRPTIKLNQLSSIELITEENKKKVLGTVVGAGVGLAILGPLGAAVGLLTGGNKKEVHIAAQLFDGRSFIAKCTSKTYTSLLPYVEKNKGKADDTKECPMCAETVKGRAKICRFCNHKF